MKKSKNTAGKLLLAALTFLFAGCNLSLPFLSDKNLIRHPDFEIYDNSLFYANGKLTIEERNYPAEEDSEKDYPIERSILEKALTFISSKIPMRNGVDIFTSDFVTDPQSFYGFTKNWKGELIDDHIYLGPLSTNPFEFEEIYSQEDYNNKFFEGLIKIYSNVLHEYGHLEDKREESKSPEEHQLSKEKLEQIATNNLGIIQGKTSEKITNPEEVYANLFMFNFFLEFQEELENHIKEAYKDKLPEKAISNLDMESILKKIIAGTFRYNPALPRSFEEGRQAIEDKLSDFNEKSPELSNLLLN
jgi:hypothetical protein